MKAYSFLWIIIKEFKREITKTYGQKQSNEQLKKAFKLFDKDNNGFITVNELDEFAKRFYGTYSENQLDELLNKLDLNEDKKISIDGNIFLLLYCFQIFFQYITQYFTKRIQKLVWLEVKYSHIIVSLNSGAWV